jgi:hypothetical protein
VAGCCECGDEPSGSFATQVVTLLGQYVTFALDKPSISTTRHEGAWGRGGIAPTHSRPQH